MDNEPIEVEAEDKLPRVLSVDDTPANLHMIEATLQGLDVVVVSVASGQEALQRVREDPDFAVVLLDIYMRGMNGFEIAEAINAHGRELPIVFVTASGERPDQVRRSYDSGAIDYIAKPLNPYVLRAKVAAFARMWRNNQHVEVLNARLAAEIEVRREAEAASTRSHERVLDLLRRRTDELERSNVELESFAQQASHDLRGPLRTIAGFAAVLAEDVDAGVFGEAPSHAEAIRHGVDRMTRLIDGIMEFGGVGEGGDFGEVNLGQVAAEVVTDLRADIERTGGQVVVDELPTVYANHSQLHRLLLNLIGNALKYHTAERPPRVHLRLVSAEPLTCEVVDNGVGFDAERASQMFEPFARLHGREFEGIGLGLNICRKIVRNHGGQISARLNEGHGSTFRFSLASKASLAAEPSG